ncbi:vacuolar protein sorting-associated protein 41 [Suillus decipiens]|nr:vacuolar protein sorting-associated protein 41 [Suillus decipiens]
MAVSAPINGPELDPWQDTRPLPSDVSPNGSNPSADDYHTDDMPSSLNGAHHSTNGNTKGELQHTNSYDDDKNASDTGDVDSENAAHESDSGEDESESGDEDDDEEGEENEGEGEEEEDECEDDYEDEEDEEPTLKYERMSGAINDLLKKDSASALAVSNNLLALGTHNGIVHIIDLTGKRIKSYKPHQASVSDTEFDSTADFVATASIDGQVVIQSLSTHESYMFDMKRPIRTVALEPNFAKKSTRSFVCGGMAGTLILREKGWLGHKETVLHSGEGPVWHVRWRERLIAWANDLGVKIYDTQSQMRITFIERPANSPRADLFKCTLHWQDDTTLLIGWADCIKIARIRERLTTTASSSSNQPPLIVEITAAFQLDCMISGIVSNSPSMPRSQDGSSMQDDTPSSFLILAYQAPDTYGDEMTEDRARQARKTAERPELRIISHTGEELSADALGVTNYQAWSCNDYVMAEVDGSNLPGKSGRCHIVISPKDVVIVRPRDRKDHVLWLVDHQRYDEALEEVEKLDEDECSADGDQPEISPIAIGERYIRHLVAEGNFAKAASLCPTVCSTDVERWESWIFVFAQSQQLQSIIPHVPTEAPQLGHLVYEMILAHFLVHDRQSLVRTIKEWPKSIYDISTVIVAVQAELDRSPSSSSSRSLPAPDAVILMECLAELYTANRQYGKALPFFLRLRRQNVFELIREHNLFTDVKDQVLLLIEFDQELLERRKQLEEGTEAGASSSEAIALLVDHIHSIPIARVVQQLRDRPFYLFLYLDALFKKDSQLGSEFADLQVTLFAEFATHRLIDYLRASTSYNLEAAYNECKNRDLVSEMVFLLGRMGNNKKALTLIIERLGDVHMAIEFAKEQSDDDLWEDLLKYSETRPTFIRGLLENVGAEIDPIRLIRRIKNGLEIPGLQEALIKILHDFHLQISLLEGCQTILNGDSSDLAKTRSKGQNSGFFMKSRTICVLCTQPLQRSPQDLLLLFLCHHVVHANCVDGMTDIYNHEEPSEGISILASGVSAKIAFASVVRARIHQGCPVCHRRSEGNLM